MDALKSQILFAGMALTLLTGASTPMTDSPAHTQSGLYKGPVVEKKVEGVYPSSTVTRGQEGVSLITFYVDDQGVPQDVTAAMHAGPDILVNNAIDAIKQWRFKPATLDGQPIDSGLLEMPIYFTMFNSRGNAHRHFAWRHRKALEELKEGNLSEAIELANAALSHAYPTLYELAFYYELAARISRAQGDHEAQRHHLELAELSFDDSVPADLKVSVLAARVVLEFKESAYGEALDAYARLRKLPGSDGMAARLQKVVDRIYETAASTSVITVKGKIGSSGRWREKPLRSEAVVESTTTDIALIKAQCDDRHMAQPFHSGTPLKIPASWKNCRLELVGKPGAEFTVSYQGDPALPAR